MKLLVDHCVPGFIVDALLQNGHEATRLIDVADPRFTDDEVAALAAQTDAVLLTADNDFALRVRFPPRKHSGIILLRDLHAAPGRVLRRLLRLLDRVDRNDLRGALTVLDRRSARRKS